VSISLDPALRGLDDCGCCTGIEERTPAPVANRPGLPAIAYRVGTHSTFLGSLLAGLSTADHPQLRRLTTREPEDFTIGFLDAVATAADVLTFYQERIANESYLATATERRSILELARAIGYELAPGVAAETVLAFTIEGAVGGTPVAQVDEGTKVQSVPGPGERPQTFETVEAIEARPEWNELVPRQTQPVAPFAGQTTAYLAGVATNLAPGDAFLIVGDERVADTGSERWDLRFVDTVKPDHDRGVTTVTWKRGLGSDDGATPPAAANPRFYALRKKASLFGGSAPDWRTLPKEVRTRYDADSESNPLQDEWPGLTISAISAEADVIHVDGLHREILTGSWLVLGHGGDEELFDVEEVDESSRKGFALAAKTTRTKLGGEHLDAFEGHVRDAVVYAQSEGLAFAETPIDDAVEGKTIDLDRVVTPLPPGRLVVVGGTSAGVAATETATVDSTEELGGVTRLHLSGDLAGAYERSSVSIAVNAARATHGESTGEPIGSGDAAAPFQRFELRQSPLTYVYADAPPGRRATLEVRVDGLRWDEVPMLFGHGPRERVYTIRIGDDAKAQVGFGDGRTGARLPSGSENVHAGYRKGLGRDGNLDPGAVTLLTTRPLGVKAVTNPIAATGGTDPEVLADARTNAPLTVLTLGRIVSLADYADFARAFEGVAKAHATWVWGRAARQVLLTVAGSDGADVPGDGPVHEKLLAAIRKAGDPNVPVTVASYEPVPFRLAATIERDEAFLAVDVLAAAEAELTKRFSFTARAFGQAVPLSEVLAVLHGVRGLVSVDVNTLYSGSTPDLSQSLPALVPLPGEDAETAQPAQLLTIDVRHGDLEVLP
jgi:predicted phage baseplate assembly protein